MFGNVLERQTSPESAQLLIEAYYTHFGVYNETKKLVRSNERGIADPTKKTPIDFLIENFGSSMYHESEDPYVCTEYSRHLEDFSVGRIHETYGLSFKEFMEMESWKKRQMLKHADHVLRTKKNVLSSIEKELEDFGGGVDKA